APRVGRGGPAPAAPRLVAYVALDPGAALGAEGAAVELGRFVRGALPATMAPAAFVTLDALPLTPSGKVDRLALPAPEWGRARPDAPTVAPRTEVEGVLAGIWANLLGTARVGVADSYFRLAGPSRLCIPAFACGPR